MMENCIKFEIEVSCSMQDGRVGKPKDTISREPLFTGATTISYETVKGLGSKGAAEMGCRMLAKGLLATIQGWGEDKPMTEDELFEKMQNVRDEFKIALDENGWEENESEGEGG